MISLNPAFDFLRKYKPCEQHTEELVMKKVRGKNSQDELITIFEKGVTGEFGKFVVADPQTLLGWVAQYNSTKNSASNYLQTGLLDVKLGMSAHGYPWQKEDWEKEANKCLTAFINGVSEAYFHPHVYDRMMLDGKISMNAYKEFTTSENEEEIIRARQKVLAKVFTEYKKKGWHTVYFIIPNSK